MRDGAVRGMFTSEKRSRADGHACALAASTLLIGALLPGKAVPYGAMQKDAVCVGRAYVSNSASEEMSVIDINSNEVIASITLGKGTVNPTFSVDGKQVFVSHTGSDTVSVIDVASNHVVSTVRIGASKPSGLAFTPNGKLVVTLLGAKTEVPGSRR